MKNRNFLKCHASNKFLVWLQLLLLFIATSIEAATVVVTNFNDSGAGSLRQALANAASGDTIRFLNSGVITLSSGELLVNKSVSIIGPGATKLAINGNGTSRVFHISSGIVVTIASLTITNGAALGAFPNDRGAGIFNERSTLTVSNCVVRGNSASQDGGGIYNNGVNGSAVLQILNSCIDGNTAFTGSGGGIANNGEIGNGNVQITRSILSGNLAGNLGGGILNQGDSGFATMQIDSSMLSSNAGSLGGGIANMGGTLVIQASTLNGNSAITGDGGAIASFGQLQSSTVAQIIECTLSSNTAAHGSGGAIANAGAPRASASASILFSTLNGNSAGGSPGGGGGIANVSSFGGIAMVQIGSTILNAGATGQNIFNASGTIASLGYNMSSDAGGGVLTTAGDQINANLKLGPLQDNGGPTLTHALLPDSPAINAGNPAFTPPPNYDQRGPGFPRVLGSRIDIGSFEARPSVTNQLSDLIALIQSLPIQSAIKNELIGKVQQVLNVLTDKKKFNACFALDVFIFSVRAQSHTKLTSDQANRLLDAANQIRTDLSCQ